MTNNTRVSRITLRRTILVWVFIMLLASPVAVFAALVAGYFVSPSDPGPFSGAIPIDPPLISLLRASIFGIIAGTILGTSQWLILRLITRIHLWIPATIFGLMIGMIAFYSTDPNWHLSHIPQWLYKAFVGLVPALGMATMQALLLHRERHLSKWWFLAGGMTFALPMIGFFTASFPGLVCGGLAGAIFSALVIPVTFFNSVAS